WSKHAAQGDIGKTQTVTDKKLAASRQHKALSLVVKRCQMRLRAAECGRRGAIHGLYRSTEHSRRQGTQWFTERRVPEIEVCWMRRIDQVNHHQLTTAYANCLGQPVDGQLTAL